MEVRNQIAVVDLYLICSLPVTIGVIAGAIGTSSLLKTNQRAMASATVGFVGFGLVLLCLIAVPAIAQLVRTVAGG